MYYGVAIKIEATPMPRSPYRPLEHKQLFQPRDEWRLVKTFSSYAAAKKWIDSKDTALYKDPNKYEIVTITTTLTHSNRPITLTFR